MLLKRHPLRSVFFLTTSLLIGATYLAEPSRAATFALSEAEFSFNNFNQTPFDIVTDSDTDALAISTDGVVEADSDADALFEVTPIPFAHNFFINETSGEGLEYKGFTESEAAILGSFEIAAKSTFLFNFSGFLQLITEIDSIATETANAFGGIAFGLFDITNPDESPIKLDFFELFGNLDTPGKEDFLEFNNSKFVALDRDQTDLSTNFGGKEESAIASITGSYSRYFEQDTVVALLEIKQGEATVEAQPEQVSVPEPSSIIALMTVVGSSVLGARTAKRQSKT